MSNSHWIPANNNNIWIERDGSRIMLDSDPVICLSNEENIISHKIAASILKRDYGICVANRPPRHCFLKLKFAIKRVGYSCLPRNHNWIIFGVDLQESTFRSKLANGNCNFRYNSQYKLHVDKFFVQSIGLLTRCGLDMLGLFEANGCPIRTHHIVERISKSDNYTFDDEFDVPEIANLIKIYLLMVPKGCFTEALEAHFISSSEFPILERIDILSKLVRVLPRANRDVLFLLFALFYQIWTENGNDITFQRLTCVFRPLLFRSELFNDENVAGTLETMIQFFPMIFILKAQDFDEMYKVMVEKSPNKVNRCIRRRMHQTQVKEFNIPICLHAITGKIRFFHFTETIETPAVTRTFRHGTLVRNSGTGDLRLLDQTFDESPHLLERRASLSNLFLDFDDTPDSSIYINRKNFFLIKIGEDSVNVSIAESKGGHKAVWTCDVPDVQI